MRRFGLIGKNIANSYSPRLFKGIFEKEGIKDAIYTLFPLENTSDLIGLLSAYPDIMGLNVTIPFKGSVIPYLDSLSAEAREIGAVNCLSIDNGSISGYNTDWKAFAEDLKSNFEIANKKALILGSGGASKAVAYAFKKLGIEYKTVSRSGSISTSEYLSYEELDEQRIREHEIIVNATPLGMKPDTESYPPIQYQYLTPYHLCYDLIYNPEVTEFMKNARKSGAKVTNGYQMLVLQAEKSWEIWNR